MPFFHGFFGSFFFLRGSGFSVEEERRKVVKKIVRS